MAKCKCSKCGSTRIVSNIVQNMPNGCFDVCTTPICGSPDELSILAPLIYVRSSRYLTVSWKNCGLEDSFSPVLNGSLERDGRSG